MIYYLLIAYQIKHFVCDFPLQNQYMLGKFKGGKEWILPLISHAAVHGVATLLIALTVNPNVALFVAALDFVAHFIIDRIKASPNLLGRYEALDKNCYPGIAAFARGDFLNLQLNKEQADFQKTRSIKRLKENKYFWWALGADQMAHHLTHYVIIWILLN